MLCEAQDTTSEDHSGTSYCGGLPLCDGAGENKDSQLPDNEDAPEDGDGCERHVGIHPGIGLPGTAGHILTLTVHTRSPAFSGAWKTVSRSLSCHVHGSFQDFPVSSSSACLWLSKIRNKGLKMIVYAGEVLKCLC